MLKHEGYNFAVAYTPVLKRAIKTPVAAACEEATKTAAKAHETTVNDAPLDPARLVELAQRVHSAS